MLSDSEKYVLLQIARQSIEAMVSKRDIPKPVITSPALQDCCGAFVTLHKHQELRGCIGYVDSTNPLWEVVQEVAAKAALEDPRFTSVQHEELQHIEIEVSVISPLMEITSVSEIEIGTHGLVVELGSHRGLLLPQVAVSTGWDKETFLEQTFRKSGLPPHLWHHKDTKLFAFTAEVFNETAASRP